MRTHVLVLPEAQQQLAALARSDPKAAAVAQGYLSQLKANPMLGKAVDRGLLRSLKARRVYFSRETEVRGLLDAAFRRRRADQPLQDGPPHRIVYVVRRDNRRDLQLVLIASVGLGHARRGEVDAYKLAERALRRAFSIPSSRKESRCA